MKLGYLVSISVLLAILLLAGCAQPAPSPSPAPSPAPAPSPKPSPAPAPAPSPKATTTAWPPPGAKPMPEVIFAGKEAGGTAYAVAVGVSNIYNRYAKDSKMRTDIFGGAGGMAKAFDEGKAHIVGQSNFFSNETYMGRIKGMEGFKTRFRYLFGGGGTGLTKVAWHTRGDLGIKTFADLKGKKVGAECPLAPWASYITDGMLKANGMTRNDIKWITFSTAAVAAKEVLEGRLDAFVYVVGSASEEIAASPRKLYLIPISDKELAEIQKQDASFLRWTSPQGEVGQTVDTPSLAMVQSLVITPQVDEYTAYYMAKIFAEHPDEVAKIHSSATGWILKYANSPDFSFTFPFHPGAIRFLKEAKLWGARENAKQREVLDKEMKIYGSVPDMAKFKELGVYD